MAIISFCSLSGDDDDDDDGLEEIFSYFGHSAMALFLLGKKKRLIICLKTLVCIGL
jgi:hypothetical protein